MDTDLFKAQTDAQLLIAAAKRLDRYLRQPDFPAAHDRAKIIKIYLHGLLLFLEEQTEQG